MDAAGFGAARRGSQSAPGRKVLPRPAWAPELLLRKAVGSAAGGGRLGCGAGGSGRRGRVGCRGLSPGPKPRGRGRADREIAIPAGEGAPGGAAGAGSATTGGVLSAATFDLAQPGHGRRHAPSPASASPTKRTVRRRDGSSRGATVAGAAVKLVVASVKVLASTGAPAAAPGRGRIASIGTVDRIDWKRAAPPDSGAGMSGPIASAGRVGASEPASGGAGVSGLTAATDGGGASGGDRRGPARGPGRSGVCHDDHRLPHRPSGRARPGWERAHCAARAWAGGAVTAMAEPVTWSMRIVARCSGSAAPGAAGGAASAARAAGTKVAR